MHMWLEITRNTSFDKSEMELLMPSFFLPKAIASKRVSNGHCREFTLNLNCPHELYKFRAEQLKNVHSE